MNKVKIKEILVIASAWLLALAMAYFVFLKAKLLLIK
jgi:hypothetical protein